MVLENLQPYQFEQFRNSLMRSKLSKKSINNCLGTLSSMMNRAVEWGMIEQNPCLVKPLKLDRNKSFNWWGVKRIFRNSYYYEIFIKCYPFYLLLFYWNENWEILALSKDDDFNVGRINVWRQWQASVDSFTSPKNESSDLSIPKLGENWLELRAAVKEAQTLCLCPYAKWNQSFTTIIG